MGHIITLCLNSFRRFIDGCGTLPRQWDPQPCCPHLVRCGNSSLWGRGRGLPVAHSEAHCAIFEQMRSSVRPALTPSREHCQTTRRFQPESHQARSFRLSRLTFFDHFSIQNAVLDLGIVESLQPCLCQKHPRTSMIVRAWGTTISGLPGYLLSHTLNRQPRENSCLRTRISGEVSLPRIFAISRLRCSLPILSIDVSKGTLTHPNGLASRTTVPTGRVSCGHTSIMQRPTLIDVI